MWIGVVSLIPEIVRQTLNTGVVGRALSQGLVELDVFDHRAYATDRHNTVDDRPYGGGPGMVMRVEPLTRCVDAAVAACPTPPPFTIFLSPQGEVFDQQVAGELAERESLLLVAGRYEGVDERFIESRVDLELSIGDYVLSGGDLAAMVVFDAVVRLLPGTLGNPESTRSESHSDGLLGYPHYTRPQDFRGQSVPEVLLSGDHKAVDLWRHQQAILRTWQRRPELFENLDLSEEDKDWLRENGIVVPTTTVLRDRG